MHGDMMCLHWLYIRFTELLYYFMFMYINGVKLCLHFLIIESRNCLLFFIHIDMLCLHWFRLTGRLYFLCLHMGCAGWPLILQQIHGTVLFFMFIHCDMLGVHCFYNKFTELLYFLCLYIVICWVFTAFTINSGNCFIFYVYT